jgi:hypothetical protein
MLLFLSLSYPVALSRSLTLLLSLSVTHATLDLQRTGSCFGNPVKVRPNYRLS